MIFLQVQLQQHLFLKSRPSSLPKLYLISSMLKIDLLNSHQQQKLLKINRKLMTSQVKQSLKTCNYHQKQPLLLHLHPLPNLQQKPKNRLRRNCQQNINNRLQRRKRNKRQQLNQLPQIKILNNKTRINKLHLTLQKLSKNHQMKFQRKPSIINLQ